VNQFNMSNNKQRVMRAAVAAALGLAATQTYADVNMNTAAGAVKIASEIPSTTTGLANAGNALDLFLTSPQGVVPTATDAVFIRINLSNNVRFSGVPTLACSAASALGGTLTSLVGTIQAGGNGSNFVTFSITPSAALATSANYLTGTCTAAGFTGITGIASAGLVNISVTARSEYKDGASYTTAFLSDKSYITYVQGVTVKASAASALVVDATSGSDNFDSAQSDLTSQTLARAGRYIVTAVGTSAATATLAGNVSGEAVFSGATVTVSGATLAAALATNSTAGVFLSTAATCAAGTTTGVFSSTANAGSTVTFTGLSTAVLTDTGVQVCLNISGNTTQIATGAIYAGSTGVFAASVTSNLGGVKQLVSVTTNGVTKNAYIVHSPTSTAKSTQLWFRNTGANAGTIYASCYNTAGTLVGTANSTLTSSLALNQLLKKTALELFTAIGYSGYTSTEKFSCVFSGGLAGMEVINQTQDIATGAIAVTQSQTN